MATTFQTAAVGSWLRVSQGLENVIISHDSVHAVHVHPGTAAPSADSAYHRCTAGAGNAFSMAGVPGQDVYIRSGGPSAVQVAVTAV